MRSTKATRHSRQDQQPGQRPAGGGPLHPVMRSSKHDSPSHGFDVSLFTQLMNDGKRPADLQTDSIKTLGRREAGTIKNKHGSSERVWMLEEELAEEKQKVEALEMEIEDLEERLENNKDEYKRNLEIFSGQIKNYKNLHNELIKEKEEGENRALEIEELRNELNRFKNAAKSTLEFIIKAFEIIALLPEQVEVDCSSQNTVEFSFEEKRTALMPKNIFLENKIVKFLEYKQQLLTDFKLESLLIKIIEEYEKKKNQSENFTSPKVKRSSSKKKRSRDQKTSPKSRSPKLRKLADSFSGVDQSSFEKSGDMQVEKGASLSHSKSYQNSSGGKSNNYSININLVVNDNSDSMISDQNQSVQGGSQAQSQSFIKYFEKELGCGKDKSDSSIIMNDSLMYSPSDRSSKMSELLAQVQETNRSLQLSEKAEYVMAQFKFEKDHADDIDLVPGDKLKVISKSPSGWWVGQNLTTGFTGKFPSNFVRGV